LRRKTLLLYKQNFEARQDHFIRSTSRKKGKDVCPTHFIRAVVLEQGVLEHMRLVLSVVSGYEEQFRRAMGNKHKANAKRELAAKVYRRITCANSEVVWRCANQVEQGKKYCKNSPTISETELVDKLAVLLISGHMVNSRNELLSRVRDIIDTVAVNIDGSLHVYLRVYFFASTSLNAFGYIPQINPTTCHLFMPHKRKQYTQAEGRMEELNRLFKRIYEDRANVELSENRYKMLAADYEQEQDDLQNKLLQLDEEICKQEEQAENIDRFIGKARKYLNLKKLAPAILNDMVKTVHVLAPVKEYGRQVQDIEISNDLIGILPYSLLNNLHSQDHPLSGWLAPAL
jgi:hypothetical protein